MERDMNTMGPVTSKAFNRIINMTDDPKLRDTHYVMSIIADEKKTNFKTLSAQLKETMIEKGICQKDDQLSVFINELGKRLFDLESTSTTGKALKKDSLIKKAKRWFNDNDSSYNSIDDFDEAVKVCFALALDYQQSILFLNKIGHHSFNLRDAKEAIYMYCILAGKSYDIAESLIEQYYEYNVETNNTPTVNDKKIIKAFSSTKESSSDSTTVFFRKFLKGTLMSFEKWDDENVFLKDILIPNKAIFLGYSKTTALEYYRLKIYFFAFYFIKKIELLEKFKPKLETLEKLKSKLEPLDYEKKKSKYKSLELKYYQALSTLGGSYSLFADDDSVFRKLKVQLNIDLETYSNHNEFLFEIIRFASESKNIDSLTEVVLYFNEVINDETILLDTITALKSSLDKQTPLITRLKPTEESNNKKGEKINTEERLIIEDVKPLVERLKKQAIKDFGSFEIPLPCRSSEQRNMVFKLAKAIKKEILTHNQSKTGRNNRNPDLRCSRDYLILILLAYLPPTILVQLNERHVIIENDQYNNQHFKLRLKINGQIKVYDNPSLHQALKSYLAAKGLGRRLNNKDFTVSNTVLGGFPTPQFFSKFETDPAIMYKGIATRKAMVLMYYIAYSYNSAINLSTPVYYSPFGSEFGFVAFHKRLNRLLDKCQFGIMDPANHFDWLILRSFFDLTKLDREKHIIDPIYFFNGILNLSHEEKNIALRELSND